MGRKESNQTNKQNHLIQFFIVDIPQNKNIKKPSCGLSFSTVHLTPYFISACQQQILSFADMA